MKISIKNWELQELFQRGFNVKAISKISDLMKSGFKFFDAIVFYKEIRILGIEKG